MLSGILPEYERYSHRDFGNELCFWWMEWSVLRNGGLHNRYDRGRIRDSDV